MTKTLLGSYTSTDLFHSCQDSTLYITCAWNVLSYGGLATGLVEKTSHNHAHRDINFHAHYLWCNKHKELHGHLPPLSFLLWTTGWAMSIPLSNLQIKMTGFNLPSLHSVSTTQAESYNGRGGGGGVLVGSEGSMLKDWPIQEWPEPLFNEIHRNVTNWESYFRENIFSIITTVRSICPWIKIPSMSCSLKYKLSELASSFIHTGSH